MLVKKELEHIPLPVAPKTKEKSCYYSSHVAIHNLDKSGRIIVIDIFEAKSGNIALRFFSDGKTFLTSTSWPVEEWTKKQPETMLQGRSVSDTEEDRETVQLFLDSTPWRHSVKDYMCEFVREINSQKYQNSVDAKNRLMKEHFSMFSEYPKDLQEYCENNVFKTTILFVSKISKNEREVTCGHCGNKYHEDKEKSKPGKDGACPKCGVEGQYKGIWTNAMHESRAKILIAGKHNAQLLLRWTNVKRLFIDSKARYIFEDYYRNLYLYTKDRQVIYGYKYQNVMYYGWDWYRKQNGDVNYEETCIYTNNLNEVFGERYYNVNLQEELNDVGQINFARLLDNLKNIPAAEYLLKMRLRQLASCHGLATVAENGMGFSGILGVSKQYLPLYKKHDVTREEHNVIKSYGAHISDESFAKFRSLNFKRWQLPDVEEVLDTMSIEKFINYISKQKEKSNCSDTHKIVIWYKDYIFICRALGVDLRRKSVRYPDNINYAHALIVARNNEKMGKIKEEQKKEKNEKELRKFEAVTERLYREIGEYRKGEYLITYPAKKEDFIIEGTSLNHCVGAMGGETYGGESYFEKHIKGKSIIAFVRKIVEPQIPYFTIEIDMDALRVMQLRGFGDCNPPKEVKAFVDGWVRHLKSKAERKAS